MAFHDESSCWIDDDQKNRDNNSYYLVINNRQRLSSSSESCEPHRRGKDTNGKIWVGNWLLLASTIPYGEVPYNPDRRAKVYYDLWQIMNNDGWWMRLSSTAIIEHSPHCMLLRFVWIADTCTVYCTITYTVCRTCTVAARCEQSRLSKLFPAGQKRKKWSSGRQP